MNGELGFVEGEICNRRGCKGTVKEHAVENCSCHINPPCSACTTPRGFCPDCGWEASDDKSFNDFIVNVDPSTGIIRTYTPRPLDSSKIDYHSLSHTNASMIKRGVYPEGTTQEEVLKLVKGTFGGRFNYFKDGKFEYVAYTD